ncbi:hypothetical protein YW7DRAFT_06995 [Streptomyces sp. AmelKG-E11A]|nr:hypothetical protein YW7DRAFT_06995 [Streptomyces sp. AmelKG-E11A]
MEQSKSAIAAANSPIPAHEAADITRPVVIAVDVEDEE